MDKQSELNPAVVDFRSLVREGGLRDIAAEAYARLWLAAWAAQRDGHRLDDFLAAFEPVKPGELDLSPFAALVIEDASEEMTIRSLARSPAPATQ